MLHGYAQNAYMMKQMMDSTVKECDQDLEFYYLDAPMVLTPNDHRDNSHVLVTPTALPIHPVCAEPTRTPAYSSTARGWFKIDDQMIRKDMVGLEDSLVLLMNVLAEHNFEAIFGFSQGGSVAERIAHMLERPDLYPAFFSAVKVHPAPLRFIVAISGFLVRGPCSSWEMTPSVKSLQDPSMFIETPMLHILGRTDIVVIRERSEILVSYSRNCRVEEHVGGHVIPTHTRWRKFFAAFLRDPFGDIESPSIPSLKDGIHVSLTLPQFSLHLGRTLTAPHAAVDEESNTDHLTPASSNSSLPDTPNETLTPVDNIILPWESSSKAAAMEYALPSDMTVKDNYYINYIEA
ncbi:hypothetical protein HWV62_9763 [Athelia sp. TMB]|nr:hypothetical protein HWV62_9763 [Athelia sp. TMB]